MKRVSFSSLESVMALLEAYPRLSTVPALQSLRTLAGRQAGQQDCCGRDKDLSAYRDAYEAGLRALTSDQINMIKQITGAQEIAYYVRVGNNLMQKVV